MSTTDQTDFKGPLRWPEHVARMEGMRYSVSKTATYGRGDLKRVFHNKMECKGRLSLRLIRQQVRRTWVRLEVYFHITLRWSAPCRSAVSVR